MIARAQYDMGRSGWFEFSQKDIERIRQAVADAVQRFFSGAKK
jgi:hypothetical protein